MLLCNPRKQWMATRLPSHKPDHTTCSLAAFHLFFTCCSSTCKSLSSFKAQPNCIPPAYPLLLSIALSLPLLYSSSIPQPYTLQLCFPTSSTHHDTASHDSSTTAQLSRLSHKPTPPGILGANETKHRTCLHTSVTSLPQNHLTAVLQAPHRAGTALFIDVKLPLAFFVSY